MNDGFIAVVGAGEHDDLWQVLRASGQRAGRDFGGVEVRTFAPDETSHRQQTELIRKLPVRELRGLCVQPVDAQAILPVLDEMRSAGVLVVTMVHPVASEFPYHHCGAYEPDVGRAMARVLIEGLGESGTIALLRRAQPRGALAERFRGFRSEIEHAVGVTILREMSYNGDAAAGRELVRDCCERFPRLNGFFLIDNGPLYGKDPQANPLVPPTCKLVTADPFPAVWDRVASGQCHAMVGLEYDQIAYKAVQWCIASAGGGEVRIQTYWAPVRTVWAGNLDSWKAQWLRWMRAPGERSRPLW